MDPAGRFIKYLQYEKRYSGHTLTAYRKDLEQFFGFMADTYRVETPGDLTYFYIRSWVVSLMDGGLTPRTVNRKISSLKSFFRFLLREKAIRTNPMTRIVAPKVPKRLPGFVQKDHMETLLDRAGFPEGFEGLRDRTILEMLYGTGMRRAELCGLRLSDLDRSGATVKVLGKRNKERIVPLGPGLARLLNEYLRERAAHAGEAGTATDALFLEKGKAMKPEKAYALVRKYLRRMTAGQHAGPHVLRHTFATHMLDAGADINAIKELLGHASLAATQVYTHNSVEKLKNVYKQAHPKA